MTPQHRVKYLTLVIGFAVGVALPSLGRLFAVRRINRLLARRQSKVP